jgi:hypothetical protein
MSQMSHVPLEMLDVPCSFGTLEPSLADTLVLCAGLGVPAVVVGTAAIDAWLGAPPAPAGLQTLPIDAIEAGLTELEQEVLQDEIDLARHAFAEQLRRWRGDVTISRLEAVRDSFASNGIEIVAVASHDLVHLCDDDVEYVCRVTRALGARAVVTPLTLGGARRLGPFGDRHGVAVAFDGHLEAPPTEFEAAFGHAMSIGVIVDIRDWVDNGHGSPLPFLERHFNRVTYVRMRTSTGDVASDDDGLRALNALQASDDRLRSLPLAIASEPAGTRAECASALGRALALYRLGRWRDNEAAELSE